MENHELEEKPLPVGYDSTCWHAGFERVLCRIKLDRDR